MFKKTFWLLFCMSLLLGCATAYRMTNVSLGMSKDEVIKKIGKPVSVSAQGGTEYLHYRFSETGDDDFHGITTPYYVRLVDGKVESYGCMGDFDSAKPTETKSIIDLNIKNK